MPMPAQLDSAMEYDVNIVVVLSRPCHTPLIDCSVAPLKSAAQSFMPEPSSVNASANTSGGPTGPASIPPSLAPASTAPASSALAAKPSHAPIYALAQWSSSVSVL